MPPTDNHSSNKALLPKGSITFQTAPYTGNSSNVNAHKRLNSKSNTMGPWTCVNQSHLSSWPGLVTRLFVPLGYWRLLICAHWILTGGPVPCAPFHGLCVAIHIYIMCLPQEEEFQKDRTCMFYDQPWGSPSTISIQVCLIRWWERFKRNRSVERMEAMGHWGCHDILKHIHFQLEIY